MSAETGLQMYDFFLKLQGLIAKNDYLAVNKLEPITIMSKFLASGPKSFFCGLAFFDGAVAPGGEK